MALSLDMRAPTYWKRNTGGHSVTHFSRSAQHARLSGSVSEDRDKH